MSILLCSKTPLVFLLLLVLEVEFSLQLLLTVEFYLQPVDLQVVAIISKLFTVLYIHAYIYNCVSPLKSNCNADQNDYSRDLASYINLIYCMGANFWGIYIFVYLVDFLIHKKLLNFRCTIRECLP